MNSSDLAILEGEIYEIIYQNEDNGYTVCDISCNNSLVTVCGHMPFIAPGIEVRLTGKWVNHPEYGEQFSVSLVERSLPKKTSSILSYLSSGIVSGVRESTARKIVGAFGEETLEIIALYPERLAEIKGISLSRAKKISDSYLIKQDAAQTVMFLQEYGVTANLALKIHKRFGKKAQELISENPYILCDTIDRIGFKTADRIAANLNFPKNHTARISSGIKYTLLEAALSGHTCLEHGMLINECARILRCTTDEIEESYYNLKSNCEIIFEDGLDFLPYYYNMEIASARKLSELMKSVIPVSSTIKKDIEEYSARTHLVLSDMQQTAIKMANEYGVVVITGGPGTGKTTIMKIILEMFKAQELKTVLCAPTGKAAKRLSESCNEKSLTLHRLLEAQSSSEETDSRNFARNEHNPVDADVVIIDEMSMVDIVLFGSLLKALKRGTRLIMAGDSDQLPSVGPGNVLHDILKSELIPSVRLNEIFRQAEKSRIVTNAHRINQGLMPLENDNSSDFFFMPRSPEAALDTICELCSGRLNKAYGFDSIRDIQVLSPSKKGVVGTINLNKVLQKILNPPSKSKKEKGFGERIFRTGDKVIQTKNNYDLLWSSPDGKADGIGIFNGDIGVILDISTRDKTLTIIFDDSKVVEYDFSSVEDLEIAYAMTVHKSQGSEWSAVIVPVCSFPPMLMTRNLLYTAVTRAKKLAILVGSDACVFKMVENNHVQIRYSRLTQRIKEAFI